MQLRRLGQFVFADRLRFETPLQELEASGNVRLEQQGDVLQGDYLRFNLGTERGFMDKPAFKLTPLPRKPAPSAPPSPGPAWVGELRSAPRALASWPHAQRRAADLPGTDRYRMEPAVIDEGGHGNDDWCIRAK